MENKIEIVKNRDNSDRVVLRASSGMFMLKPDPLSKQEIQKSILTKVSETDAQGSSVIERVLDCQIEGATTSAHRPLLDKLGNVVRDEEGNIVTFVDSKVLMASAKAASVVLKASGLEQPEKEQVQLNRVEIVIITPPAHMMNKEVTREEDAPYHRPMKQPSFAEVESIYTNEPS